MSIKDFTRGSGPHFCIITPITYLDIASQSPKHLVLAHLVDKNDGYAEFYKARSDAGNAVIMDNGAYELGKSYDPEKLIELGKKCGADAIVLPDYPFVEAHQTIDAAQTWIPLFKNNGFKTMFVPQSKKDDLEDWINAYMWATDHPDIDIIGMSILGIPNALPHVPASYARVVMTEILADRGIFASEKYHHYLGLNAGPNLEIPTLIKTEALDSCDSSNPVWAAISGFEYGMRTDSYLPVSKDCLKPVDFYVAYDYEAIPTIQHNLKFTLDLFKSEDYKDVKFA